MAFKTWQTGVHIQQDRVLIVALDREKSGWRLRRWWAIPLAEGIIRDGKICQPEQLVDALRDWRKTLPHAHRVFLSFPAARTLQRSLPRPTVALRDSEQLSWLGSALARELEMSADTLCFDYAQDTFSNTFHVTAAQNNEVDTLLALAKTLRLRLVTITPDASADESSSRSGASEVRRLAGRSAVALGDAPPVGTPLNYRRRKRG